MKKIDIDGLLRSKATGAYPFIPRILINYMKKILHEKDINEFLERTTDVKSIEFVDASLKRLGVKIIIKGIENIPPGGGCILASNHPLGGLDGLALIYSIGKVRKDIKFFVNEFLMSLNNLDTIFVPVNIYGHSSRKMLTAVEEIYNSDVAIPIFPAGLVSRRASGKNIIKDLAWKKSFITHSRQYNKPIIPVWIEGKNSDFFYNFAKWRKRLGIKLNIEMFFLVNEMFNQKDKNVTLYFGKAVPPSAFTNENNDLTWASIFRDKLYATKASIVERNLWE